MDTEFETSTTTDYLLNACRFGDVELVTFLVNEGTIDTTDGDQALNCACYAGHLEIVKILINGTDSGADSGADGSADGNTYGVVSNFNTGLIMALENDHHKIVDFLIEKYSSEVDCVFYKACCDGNIKMVKMLIEKGPSVFVNINGGFHRACMGGYIEIIAYLVDAIDNDTFDWNLALENACYSGCIESVKFTIDHGANNLSDALVHTCSVGNLEMSKLLIDRGATNVNGGLLYSCYSKNAELIKLMLKHGATNINHCVNVDYFCNNYHIITLLMSSGADDLRWLEKTENFSLYSKYSGSREENMIDPKYSRLLFNFPAYIWYVGIKVAHKRANLKCKCSVRKLPPDLVRLLFKFF